MPIYLMERSSPGYEQPTHYSLAVVCEDTHRLKDHWPVEADSGDLERMVKMVRLAKDTFCIPIILDRHSHADREWRGLSPESAFYQRLAKAGLLSDSY